MLTLFQHIQKFITLPTVSSALLVLFGSAHAEWSCRTNSGDFPSLDQMTEVLQVFNDQFGSGTLTLDGFGNGGTGTYAVVCNGVTFGITNTKGCSETEESGTRDEATATELGGGGACVWDISPALAYEAGFEGDITWCPAVGCATRDIYYC